MPIRILLTKCNMEGMRHSTVPSDSLTSLTVSVTDTGIPIKTNENHLHELLDE